MLCGGRTGYISSFSLIYTLQKYIYFLFLSQRTITIPDHMQIITAQKPSTKSTAQTIGRLKKRAVHKWDKQIQKDWMSFFPLHYSFQQWLSKFQMRIFFFYFFYGLTGLSTLNYCGQTSTSAPGPEGSNNKSSNCSQQLTNQITPYTVHQT